MSRASELADKQIRPLRIEGGICYVPLTKGFVAMIDADQSHLVEGHNWCALVTRHEVYAMRSVQSKGKRSKVLLHRLVAGTPEGLLTDHINGNGLDNRRANLRISTRTQNNRNLRTNKANTSGVRGVSWSAKLGKWWASITVAGKKKHIGYFSDLTAAAVAYEEASRFHHGEFGSRYAALTSATKEQQK